MTLSDFNGGMRNVAGRPRGVKNKLSHKFLTDLLADYETHGKEVIAICRIEEPVSYMKMIAGLLPKEFELTTQTALSELTDEDLDRFIEHARRRLAEQARDVTGTTLSITGRETAKADL